MTVEKEPRGLGKKKKMMNNVLVGIRLDDDSRDLLNWAITRVACTGNCVIAVHVCQSSERNSKKALLDGLLTAFEGLCDEKKVGLAGEILTGRSVKKALVSEAKKLAAVALVVGTNKEDTLGGLSSMIRYSIKKLPKTTDVLALYNTKLIFSRSSKNDHAGLEDAKPSIDQMENSRISEFSEPDLEPRKSIRDGVGHGRFPSRASSFFKKEPSDQRLGWPLLRTPTSSILQIPQTRDMSVVQWVMSLPNRSPVAGGSPRNGLSASSELLDGLESLLDANSTGYELFSLDVLKSSTSQFSSENLIGKGGCNRVYKGILPDGKLVAVKVMNCSKTAWQEFSHEVSIISSLKHKHITPLVGICIQQDALISVYDFFSEGSLEEKLHGTKDKDKRILPWEVRFNAAIGVAEALNYLHNEHPRPVIHRDVKSSNILLTDRLEPQLSDFGLAIWGSTTSSFQIEDDLVGTFGYLAPEYFMFGKVSDKVDVYAFGVLLLELLSGREPISSETPKKQESLVIWAKALIESGDIKAIVDPELEGNFDEVQMQRMVLAASLCITRAARLRPNVSKILKLLKGEKDAENCGNDLQESENLDNGVGDDEVYPNSSAGLHLSLALLDVDGDLDSTSLGSTGQRISLSSEECLKEQWSRTSSFS